MPNAAYFDEDDEWSYRYSGARHVPPAARSPPRRPRMDDYGRRSDYLMPDAREYTTSLHRTRSQGAQPAPNVTIYNTSRMDNESSPNVRTDQRSPLPSPRASPRGRPLRLADEYALEDELAELRLEVARNRRSRSRSDHHHHHDSSPSHDYDKWQLQMANERLKEAEERLANEKREDLIKRKMELKYMKDRQERDEEDARIKLEEERLKKQMELKYYKEKQERDAEAARLKADEDRIKKDYELKREKEERDRERKAREAEEERKRIIAENTLKIERQEREAKEERQRAVDAYEKKRMEEEKKRKDENERIIAEYEMKKVSDAAKAKKAREDLLLQIKLEEEAAKQKEKEEWERFERKQKQKEEEEKAKKKKAEAELEDQMRKLLHQYGFQENQIQAMFKPEEVAKLQQGLSPANPLRLTQQPTYVKVHRDYIAIDTLQYYDIPYEYDRSDPNYIIILREMDQRETEVLFEHTRRLRTRGSTKLLIEERRDHGKPDYAWVRKRDRSRSATRRRSSPKRVVGIKEMFF